MHHKVPIWQRIRGIPNASGTDAKPVEELSKKEEMPDEKNDEQKAEMMHSEKEGYWALGMVGGYAEGMVNLSGIPEIS